MVAAPWDVVAEAEVPVMLVFGLHAMMLVAMSARFLRIPQSKRSAQSSSDAAVGSTLC